MKDERQGKGKFNVQEVILLLEESLLFLKFKCYS